MMLIHVNKITANYCTDGYVHVEIRTTNGKSIDITLPKDEEAQFRDDVECAVIDAEDARDKGAAGPWDGGRAA